MALPTIDLGSAVVGSTGTLDWQRLTGQSSHPAFYGPNTIKGSRGNAAHIQLFNESGAGLTIQFPSGDNLFIPAGGWLPWELDPSVTSLQYTVVYLIPNAPVSQLVAVYYFPHETPPNIPILGNSPVGIGGTVTTSSSNLVYNVQDATYGAKGDGITDDTAAIQAAIAAASAAGGGIVFFPTGTYKITATLTVSHDNIALVGADWGAILSWAGAAAGTMVQVTAPGGAGNFRYGIKIAELFINGNSIASVVGLDLQSCYGMLIDHIRIRFVNGICIHDDGIGGAFGAYNHIRNCHISDSSGVGVQTDNSEWLEVTGCHFGFFNNAGVGKAIFLQNLNCQIHSNQFDHNDISIECDFAGRHHITQNQFDRGATNYVKIRGADNCIIDENIFAGDNQTTGVDMIAITDAGSHANIISDNNAVSGGGWTNFVNETTPVTAVGNYVHGNVAGGYGILLTAGVSYSFDNSEAISTDGSGALFIRNGQTVATLRSNGGGAAGITIWVGTTDPAGNAGEGDIWLPV